MDLNHVDLALAVRQADAVGLASLLACGALSVASWTVILWKAAQTGGAIRQSDAFVRECLSGTGSLEEAYAHAERHPASPLAQILREAYLEMQVEDWYAGGGLAPGDRMTAARAGVERVMERTISNEIRHLESWLIFLATVSSTGPFVVLFGTVWGVLGSFQAMGRTGGATITALAPGMATALVATLAGLAAAIPATVAFNYFSNKIAVLTSRMDSFALELANIIEKRLAKAGGGRGHVGDGGGHGGGAGARGGSGGFDGFGGEGL